MKSEEALRARLRFLRRTHGKEPNAFEYAVVEGRIQELHNAINDKPCEICKRLTEGFKNQYFRIHDDGALDEVTYNMDRNAFKKWVAEDIRKQRSIMDEIHDHLAECHV